MGKKEEKKSAHVSLWEGSYDELDWRFEKRGALGDVFDECHLLLGDPSVVPRNDLCIILGLVLNESVFWEGSCRVAGVEKLLPRSTGRILWPVTHATEVRSHTVSLQGTLEDSDE